MKVCTVTICELDRIMYMYDTPEVKVFSTKQKALNYISDKIEQIKNNGYAEDDETIDDEEFWLFRYDNDDSTTISITLSYTKVI